MIHSAKGLIEKCRQCTDQEGKFRREKEVMKKNKRNVGKLLKTQ